MFPYPDQVAWQNVQNIVTMYHSVRVDFVIRLIVKQHYPCLSSCVYHDLCQHELHQKLSFGFHFVSVPTVVNYSR